MAIIVGAYYLYVQFKEYRSEIFYTNPEQKTIAEQVTKKIQDEKYTPKKKTIHTKITQAPKWYDAEKEHQQYLEINKSGYVLVSLFCGLFLLTVFWICSDINARLIGNDNALY